MSRAAVLGLIFAIELCFCSALLRFCSMLHFRPETLKFNQLATICHPDYPKCKGIHYELIKQICIIKVPHTYFLLVPVQVFVS